MFLDEIEDNKVIVMDNASFHCKNRFYELCRKPNKNLKKFIKYDEASIDQLYRLL